MRVLIAGALILLICAAYWVLEGSRPFAQGSAEIVDANGNSVVMQRR
jgi:hypothetical protein